MTKQELAGLLGPDAHTTLRWSRTDGPDFAVYYGESAAPSSGGVGFYLGMAPSFQPTADSTTHHGRLGAFDVVWHRTRREDGSLYQAALLTNPDKPSIHVWVYGARESDLDALIRELSALPQFRHGPSKPHQ
ncbi:hypothetical protein CfE428DRAFT_6032 [Chthoniobacter flavus Ellin428]|uniref:Uncharacterized protein n=2 Tax=Chthoniobacter flavus TaxID=191863 RepID=B4DAU1_9BACT|nr:hypothetical protein CfE428DRAFT_6032 [Chthoniobacter flavus Ellin428]